MSYYRSLIQTTLPVNPLWATLTHAYNADSNSNDQKGSANGTLVGGTTYATGIIGNAFSFDGTNDYVEFPSGTFDISGNFSFSFWIKPSSVAGYRTPFSCLDVSSYGLTIFSTSSTIQLYLLNSAGYDTINCGAYDLNVWQNFVIVRDGNNLKVYRNAVKTVDASYSRVIPSTSKTVIFGNYVGGYYYSGVIDEVQLFQGILTDSDATELYNSGLGLQYVP